MHGGLIHYYIAAYDAANRVIASKGSAGSPNIMELTGGGAPANRDDKGDPIGGNKVGGVGGGSIRGGGAVTASKSPTVRLAVAAGTGFGYVTGNTESGNVVRNCCIGNSPVVITPELAYYVTPQLSIALAGRLGLPLGANIEGHATAAAAGLLRVRYSFDPSGNGVRVMVQIGGGIMRNTIKLDKAVPDMDTDIVAQGPLLVGGGIGYTKKVGGGFSLFGDFATLAGIAVVKTLGTSSLTNGIGADLSLGLALEF
jgi:hypothetical protein